MSKPTSLWREGALRSFLLFLNFFLIMLAYYQVKPASRSLFLEYLDAGHLPYIWTASGLLLMALLPSYQRLLERCGRVRVVQGTGAVVIALLLVFRILMNDPGPVSAASFYVLVDIFSVVLVEQFWSLTNCVHDERQGRRWYGLIASGGLVGGFAGGVLASWIVRQPSVHTPDLILVAAALIAGMMCLTTWLDSLGVYRRARHVRGAAVMATRAVWTSLRDNRFLALIGLLVLFSQVCEPIVEYQFMTVVEQAHPEREARTVFLSDFLGLMSGVALAVNLLLTPMLHRYAGLIGGLMMQPVLLACSAVAFAFNQDLRSAALMKISDRGLAYSINRSSRELLYVSADPATIFRVKAWIDMVGYRSFKIAGNVVILLLTQLLPWEASVAVLSGAVLVLCVAWAGCVIALRRYVAPVETVRAPVTARAA